MWPFKRREPETVTVHTLPLSMLEPLVKPEESVKFTPRTLDRWTITVAAHAMKVMDRGIQAIEFRCSVPKENSYGLFQVTKTEFSKGDGPCGRHVLALYSNVTADLLTITQVTIAEDVTEQVAKFREGVERHQRDAKAITKHGYSSVMAMTPSQRDYEHQLVALENLSKEIVEKAGKREIKEFVYKMGDIHGRIVTTR
ncbi:hypothetical protein Mudajogi_00008 [Pseudomonas phage vB_PpuP-Mudajogi]|uniref:Uncharacterized protein n=1 Tax=Pseudomonas phage vB_PpuP-Mudajogi TaxID=3132683 RepID=A0AAX4NE78_9CAUD